MCLQVSHFTWKSVSRHRIKRWSYYHGKYNKICLYIHWSEYEIRISIFLNNVSSHCSYESIHVLTFYRKLELESNILNWHRREVTTKAWCNLIENDTTLITHISHKIKDKSKGKTVKAWGPKKPPCERYDRCGECEVEAAYHRKGELAVAVI